MSTIALDLSMQKVVALDLIRIAVSQTQFTIARLISIEQLNLVQRHLESCA